MPAWKMSPISSQELSIITIARSPTHKKLNLVITLFFPSLLQNICRTCKKSFIPFLLYIQFLES